MLRKVFLLSTVLTFGFSGYSMAQDAPVADAQVTQEAGESSVADQQKQVLLDRIVKVAGKLDKDQVTHFFVMYSNYSIISLVNNVEKDVGEAVKKCGDENPDMTERVNARFDIWKTNIGKSRDEAKENLDNMVLAQDYISKNEADEIFSMIDKTRIEADSRFQRVPVSTPEACEFMLTKMDETETTMTKVLSATLASYPNVLQKNQK